MARSTQSAGTKAAAPASAPPLMEAAQAVQSLMHAAALLAGASALFEHAPLGAAQPDDYALQIRIRANLQDAASRVEYARLTASRRRRQFRECIMVATAALALVRACRRDVVAPFAVRSADCGHISDLVIMAEDALEAAIRHLDGAERTCAKLAEVTHA